MIEKVPGPLGCFVFLLWFIAYVALAPIWLPFAIVDSRRRVRRFFRTLQENGRLITWEDFLEKTRNAQGSVIIEVGNRWPHFWWTPDKALSRAPVEPPAFRDLGAILYSRDDPHPFIKWCHDEYLSLETGRALFADENGQADFETFPYDPDYDQQMRDRFPGQEVIIVTFHGCE